MQSSKNSLAASLGNAGRKAWESHRNDETSLPLSGGDLPSGIENGVAQLTECKFDVYKEGDNKGKWFFYAHGVVVSPESYDNIPIQGKLTKIIEPLHETPTRKRATVEDHLSWIMNELRKLGLDTSGVDFDDLDSAVASLKEAAPMFSFRTWASEPTKEYPNPRTNHQWGGVTEYEVSEESSVEEEEEKKTTSKASSKKEEKPKEAVTKSSKSLKSSIPKMEYDVKAADEGDEDEQIKINEKAEALGIDSNDYGTWAEVHEAIVSASSSEPESEEEEGEEDYKNSEEYKLGLAGDKGNEEAQSTLTEYGSRFDIDPDDYETWVDVALALLEAQETNSEKYEKKEEKEESSEEFPYAGLGELGDEGDEEAQSKLGEGCKEADINPDDYETWTEVEELLLNYHNKKSGSSEFTPEKGEVYLWKPPKGKKEVECEVMSVDVKSKTVSLKDMTTKMVHKGVAFSEIG